MFVFSQSKSRVLGTPASASLAFTLLFQLLFLLPPSCPTDLSNSPTTASCTPPSPSKKNPPPFVILAITFASLFVITLGIILTFLKIRQIRSEKRRDDHRRRTLQIQEMYRGPGPSLSWKPQQQQQQRERQSDESILLTMPVLAKTKTPWKTTTRPRPPMMADLRYYPGMTFGNAV
ncbi:hypothetical protein BGW80DRAFT_1277868 [Lactifluus volemus]|nr:hypothetical protein BGW80DRAFT_1277868 [Lactifluus volemus]